jgi:hypothetical protein
MKPTPFITLFLLVSFLTSCAPGAAAPALPKETPILQSTLPATLTPMPTQTQLQATPTALYTPIPLSSEDEAAYQQALKDIPVYRQGDMQLTLQDENGRPLSGYQVKYRQIDHDFLFGGVADSYYASELKQAGINTMTVYMDWRWIEPQIRQFDLDFTNYWLGIDELKSGGMSIKTNNLFNTSEEDMASYFRGVSYDEFLTRLYNHVATTVKRFAPSVDDWEAILEPNFGNHNPLNLSKDQYYRAISTSIRAIRDNDPTAIVEINFSYPCGGLDWLDDYQIVQEMLDRKIDFDVIGLQLYYNTSTQDGTVMPNRSLSELSACYDKYEKMLAPYGKRVVGSEFSVPSQLPSGRLGYWNVPWSEDTQAQYLTTAYTLFFSKPSNMGLVWWNTLEPSSFIYQGGLIREDGTPKKAFYALQNLIDSWTTTGEGTTNANGALSFRGFGGNYEVEIVNPANGESMVTQVHITEQKESSQSISFVSSNWFTDQRATLEKLVAYWQSSADAARVQKGKDYLALVDHHIQAGEWALAKQTLAAELDELAITTEIVIPMDQLIPVEDISGGGVTTENGSYLLWGAGTIHYPYKFPAGTVSVEIKAHAHNESGESPIMVAGVGANYSQIWKVTNEQSQTYTFTTSTDGHEQDLTIRFPYDDQIYAQINQQNGNVGELKLFVDEVRLIIKSTEIPKK